MDSDQKDFPADMEEAFKRNMEYAWAMGKIRVHVTQRTDDPEERLESIEEVLDQLDELRQGGDSDE